MIADTSVQHQLQGRMEAGGDGGVDNKWGWGGWLDTLQF
jgi:hypothetical protein